MLSHQHVAIIGSGPSGFYAAERLLRKNEQIVVHMFEQLLTPYGLLRGGVAPDHQKMKSVASAYEKIALSERFHFWGGLKIGQDVCIHTLKEYYSAVVIATGANGDRQLNIEGTQLQGYHSATEFVGWYNSHPHFVDQNFDFTAQNVAIIGQGNVAVDVARILAKTEEELSPSDISLKALASMKKKAIKNIYLIGRRGPIQAAFTELEIKELANLSKATPYVDPEELILSEIDQAELAESAKARKNLAILQQYTQKPNNAECILHIKFFRSPVKIIGKDKVESIDLEINQLTGEAGQQRTVGTQEIENLNVDLIFTSIGYKGSPIDKIPFESQKGIIPNQEGRILENNTVLPGFYTCGWIKRGPSGVIGTNRKDSFETIDHLLNDLEALPVPNKNPESLIDSLRKQYKIVSFKDWQKINQIELENGQKLNKARLKFDNAEEILANLVSKS